MYSCVNKASGIKLMIKLEHFWNPFIVFFKSECLNLSKIHSTCTFSLYNFFYIKKIATLEAEIHVIMKNIESNHIISATNRIDHKT